MAGSKLEMIYKTDIPNTAGDGTKILILDVDESNARLTGGVMATPGNIGDQEVAVRGKDFKRLRPRRLLLEGTTDGGRLVRRSIIACDYDNALVKGGGTTVMGVMVGNESEPVTMVCSGVVGEKRTFLRSTDTGLDDDSQT